MKRKQLTTEKQAILNRAKQIFKNYLQDEIDGIEVLIETYQSGLHKDLEYRGLYRFAMDEFGLSEAVAHTFSTVTRKAIEVPELRRAINEGRLTVPKASRMVSALTNENAAELIAFAQRHSTRELQFEVRRINPKSTEGDRVRPVTENLLELTMLVTRAEFTTIERVEDIAASKGILGRRHAVMKACEEYEERHHPLEKAKRANERKAKIAKIVGAPVKRPEVKKSSFPQRTHIPAETKHAVVTRDGGQCTFIYSDGKRCDAKRWIEVHHIILVKDGGTNDLENLRTLCWCHHDVIHQLNLPIEMDQNSERSEFPRKLEHEVSDLPAHIVPPREQPS